MSRRITVLAGLAVILAALGVVFVLQDAPDASDVVEQSSEPRDDAAEVPSEPLPRATRTSNSEGSARLPSSTRAERPTPTTREPHRGQPPAAEGESARAPLARSSRADPNHALPTPNSYGGAESWDDPTNERVLGPKEWMAPTEQEERARINEVFEKSRAARFDPRLSNRDRGQSVAAMKAVVDLCFESLQQRAPGAQGRLIVAWTAGASGGQGTIRDPRIKVNYKLEDETFEACILDGARNLKFPAADGDPIEVEAPFFYDGAF